MSDEIRLNKYLSEAGFCSRREADRLIEGGRVTVDGAAAVMGQKIQKSQSVQVDGREVALSKHTILIAYNKPEGIECTTAAGNPANIIDAVNYPERIYPVGRLDKNSRGLILLTNDGELANGILKSAGGHEKEYIVKTDRPVTEEFIRQMAAGVDISRVDGRGNKIKQDDGTVPDSEKARYYSITRPCKVNKTGAGEFDIILTQGLNRQIRRMCQALGYKVISLKRIRIMNILLGDLAEGKWRKVSEEEYRTLKELIYRN